ncbi:MAG: hypothetical protein WD226_09130, partial [Planctomycetota bacterium]
MPRSAGNTISTLTRAARLRGRRTPRFPRAWIGALFLVTAPLSAVASGVVASGVVASGVVASGVVAYGGHTGAVAARAIFDDALERLASFGRQQARSSRRVTEAREAAFRELLDAARAIVVEQPAREAELIAALTYTAGTGVDPPDLVAEAALDALERALVLDRDGEALVQLVEHLADREP